MDTKNGAVKTHYCGRPVTNPSPDGASRRALARAVGWGVSARGRNTWWRNGSVKEGERREKWEAGRWECRMQGGEKRIEREETNQERVSSATTATFLSCVTIIGVRYVILVLSCTILDFSPRRKVWASRPIGFPSINWLESSNKNQKASKTQATRHHKIKSSTFTTGLSQEQFVENCILDSSEA
ncbi:hypothetical protein B0H13DRAFT_1891145 [Mycena leptocephala]|nr:hypothetical protein B0H13DRAFT_1891145 [Mycena leptocephala]